MIVTFRTLRTQRRSYWDASESLTVSPSLESEWFRCSATAAALGLDGLARRAHGRLDVRDGREELEERRDLVGVGVFHPSSAVARVARSTASASLSRCVSATVSLSTGEHRLESPCAGYELMAGSLKIEFTARGDAGQLQLDPSINAGDILAAGASQKV